MPYRMCRTAFLSSILRCRIGLVRYGLSVVALCCVGSLRFSITLVSIEIGSVDDLPDALFLEDFLDTLDGVALIIEQMADSAQKIDVVGTIVPATTTSFHRFDLGETRFPKAQYVLRKIEVFRNFAYCSECIRTLSQDTHLSIIIAHT